MAFQPFRRTQRATGPLALAHGAGRLRVRSVALGTAMVLLLSLLGLAACGGGQTEPEATGMPRAMVPTFTPTPQGPVVVVQPPSADPTQAPVSEPSPTPEPPTPLPPPTATPAPETPRLIVSGDVANVRLGPSTGFGLAGSVTQGMEFDVVGKNPAGDWYLFCCVNGQEGWIFADLVRVENGERVSVAQNIPAVPTSPPAPPAAPPTATPVPPPAQAANPCPAMERCTFRLRNGPKSFDNGGGEVKLTLAFIHSGRGNEAQGSYFVVLKKDGVNLGVADSVRSWTGDKRQGPGGAYNYEYKIGRDRLPGNTVNGGYEIWVLDGNANQASPAYTFGLDGNQGEVWIEFDQG